MAKREKLVYFSFPKTWARTLECSCMNVRSCHLIARLLQIYKRVKVALYLSVTGAVTNVWCRLLYGPHMREILDNKPSHDTII